MNRVLAIPLLIIVSITTWAQETKQVKKVNDNTLEIYYVLKSDKNIKQGAYEKYFKLINPGVNVKLLTEKGQYVNNEKSGIWTFYWGDANMLSKGSYEKGLKTGNWEYYDSGILVEKGFYKNDLRDGYWVYFKKDKGIIEKGSYKEGRKTGIWNYYYYNILVQNYDHTKDSVLYSFNDSTESEVINQDKSISKVVLNCLPQYIGHKRQLQSDMSKLTQYLAEARMLSLSGKVVLSFIVNEDGTTSNFDIIEDFGGKCGQAVIEAYKANKVKWIPGMYNGRKVKVKYYQTVNFELSTDPISGLGTGSIMYE